MTQTSAERLRGHETQPERWSFVSSFSETQEDRANASRDGFLRRGIPARVTPQTRFFLGREVRSFDVSADFTRRITPLREANQEAVPEIPVDLRNIDC